MICRLSNDLDLDLLLYNQFIKNKEVRLCTEQF